MTCLRVYIYTQNAKDIEINGSSIDGAKKQKIIIHPLSSAS